MPTKASSKFPKSPGGCVDAIYKLDTQLKDLKKEVKLLEEKRKLLADHTQNTFKKSDLVAAKGKFAQVEFKQKRVWNVEDWDEFYKWVKKTGHFQCMQKRLSDAAIAEIMEDKKNRSKPPVKPYDFFRMSVTQKK